MNPLLAPSTLPYNLPDFAAIRLEHVEPAFEEAVSRHGREIADILMQDTPTWENTVEALERSGADLDRVAAWFFNLQGTDATEEFDAVADRIVPKLSAHTDSIYQNDQLYQRIQAVEVPDDEESRRLHDQLARRFARRGAGLDAPAKARLLEINQRLSQLSEEFGRNLLADTRRLAVTLGEEDMAGLSEQQRQAYRDGDGYTVPLELPTTQSLQAELASPRARRALFDASLARGKDFNAALVAESARLRLERARLLGYGTHADYVIAEETAGTAAAARQLIADLAPAAAANAQAERKLAEEAAGQTAGTLDGADWPYYQARRREEELNLNEAELRNYFPLEQVLVDGVFYAAHLLYGITVKRREDLRGYRDDVAVWEVTDAPERGGRGLGLLLTDYAARPSKRGGAWMSSFVDQSHLAGTQAVVVNVMSLTSTLLSIDEVTTVFHEFGHALHGLLSDVRYPSLSGTNVPRDWVEFPSQINENYAFAPEIVRNYARHVDTGEVIPDELLKAVRAARQFGQGFETSEYLAAAAIDLAWHSLDSASLIPAGTHEAIAAFERDVLAEYGLDVDGLEPRYRSTWFNHIFAGGYSAGYYSYLWAEALDADGYELVEQRGITRATGDAFRDAILARGASRDYDEAYRAFRGRAKDTRPLLLRRGLEGSGVSGV